MSESDIFAGRGIVLRTRFDRMRLLHANLEGSRSSLAKTTEDLSNRVSLAKGRLQCAEEVTAVFTEMQQRAHARSVSDFETLLSAFMEDVLPGEGTIRLSMDMHGNAPTLDIDLIKKSGFPTNVFDDNGGAVTNIVCAGLRFAALSRTGNRKFVVLDEADNWTKPTRVPAFMKVISEAAIQSGTQTLFISHHPAEYFGDDVKVNRVLFQRDANGEVYAEAMEPIHSTWADESTPGIRAIELIDFCAHRNTYIPCFPGATAFLGDNNFGKSAAMVSSLKAVAYNESTDACINEHAKSARIVLHLEEGKRLVWTRDPNRNPVVYYELFKDGHLEPIQAGKPPGRNAAPTWVTDLLGIARSDGLEIQLNSQKTPVFLLDESAPVRAKLLSVGRESGHLTSLMKRYDDLKKADKAEVKAGEGMLSRLFAKLDVADGLDEQEVVLKKLEGTLKRVEATEQTMKEGYAWLGRHAQIQGKLAHADNEISALAGLPQAPKMLEVVPLEKLLARITKATMRLAAVPDEWPEIPVPEMLDSPRAIALLEQIWHCESLIPLMESVPFELPRAPVLQDTGAVLALVSRIKTASVASAKAKVDCEALERELETAHTDFDALMASLGGHCPLCNAPHQG